MSFLQHPATALIVVDIQNDFLPGGALPVPQGDEVIAPINRLIENAFCVVLTADWHPSRHKSFAINHPGKKPFELVDMPYGKQVLWPAHCVAGTEGSAFAEGLVTSCADLILRKGTCAERDSYSAFLEADRRTRTGLAGWLKEREICNVVVCGLAADYCVSWTALDAAQAGFDVCVVTDGADERPCRCDRLKKCLSFEGLACVVFPQVGRIRKNRGVLQKPRIPVVHWFFCFPTKSHLKIS